MQSFEKLPDGIASLVGPVLATHGLDPFAVERFWIYEIEQGEVIGALGVARVSGPQYYALANLPVVALPIDGVSLSLSECMALTTYLEDIPGGQYALQPNALCFTLCVEIPPVKNEGMSLFFATLLDHIQEIQREALVAFYHLYGERIKAGSDKETRVTLPKIKVTPADGVVIFKVLSRCPTNVQKLFSFWMEQWARAGLIVTTTAAAIVLDAPYGDRTTRLAVLMPGMKWNEAAFCFAEPQPAAAILIWEGLRQQTGFPMVAVDQYQAAVSRLAAFHITENSAQFENIEKISRATLRSLLDYMFTLVKSVRINIVEEPTGSKPVSLVNIQTTLAACDPPVRQIFEQLIAAWRAAGGTVLCGRPGRIHLKMKTKAHKTGDFSRQHRNFDLAVLVAPRGKQSATIQLALNLATARSAAYLDCIPDEVVAYGIQILAFPGIEHKGTVTRLVLNDAFREEHAQQLAAAMVRLKQAEANAL